MTSARADSQDLDIEGLDEQKEGTGWGEYPLNSVFVRNETRSVSDAMRRIDGKRYILDPEFQRDFVWDEAKQSKLIESCVMRIPLPVFYLAEAADGRIIVVDGLQRLTTFHRFVKGQLRLKGLASSENNTTANPLDGKRFDDLALNLQERILDTQLITYILDAKAPERARLDIFERVNSGQPLSRQQMRNALYSGPATAWLKDAAQSTGFRTATGGSLDQLAMRDREAINRFCAFSLLGWNDYRSGDMDGFLAKALLGMSVAPTSDLKALRPRFDLSMQVNRQLFGDHAFRKSLALNRPDAHRNPINIALWDVCSVLLARTGEMVKADRRQSARVSRAIIDLVHDEQFAKAITYSTNSTQAVSTRFELAEISLKEALS